MEQPWELILGVASTPALWPNLLLETNVILKNWGDAAAYEDIWEDTATFALDGQYTISKLKLRLGYSYTTDLLKKDVSASIAGLPSIQTPLGTTPISVPLVQFIQSTLADPFWNHQVTVGAGYALSDTIRADLHVGYSYGKDRSIGANRIEVELLTAGAGITWSF